MSLPMPTTSRTATQFPNMDSRQQQLADSMLISLIQQCCNNDLRQLLYTFFSFLHRRTDFYVVADQDQLQAGTVSMGFPLDGAEKLLLASFRQFPLRKLPKKPTNPENPKLAEPSASPAVAETSEIPSESASIKTILTPPSAAAKPSDNQTAVRYNSEDGDGTLQVPVGNGGTTKRYTWTQTLEECTVLVPITKPLPDSRSFRAKDFTVDFTSTHLYIGIKSGGSEEERLVDDDLAEAVIPSECTWTLETNASASSAVLLIVLYKKQKTFWDRICMQDEEKIDTSLVDSRRHISEYDEMTQGFLRKLLFDQSQLQQGKPTSEEILKGTGKPQLPPLPDGVEYIDQRVLDEASASAASSQSKSSTK
jgi:N-terminal conserved domain of Nudc./CS domain